MSSNHTRWKKHTRLSLGSRPDAHSDAKVDLEIQAVLRAQDCRCDFTLNSKRADKRIKTKISAQSQTTLKKTVFGKVWQTYVWLCTYVRTCMHACMHACLSLLLCSMYLISRSLSFASSLSLAHGLAHLSAVCAYICTSAQPVHFRSVSNAEYSLRVAAGRLGLAVNRQGSEGVRGRRKPPGLLHAAVPTPARLSHT